MAIDWTLLLRAREMQRTRSVRQVTAERAAAARTQVDAEQARATWRAAIAQLDRAGSATQAPGAALDVTLLREQHAYRPVAHQRVARAGAAMQEAQAALAGQQARLDAARRALRTAVGSVTKAELMQQGAHAEVERARGARAEDGIEDAARRHYLAARATTR